MKVLFLVGPTASGKSELGLRLCEELGAGSQNDRTGAFTGEIFNCDSVQVYSDLNIGAAKPSSSDLQRAPHHLYSMIDSPDTLTAGEFARLYHAKLKERERDCSLAITVGGTGFYYQAIEKGMLEIPASDSKIRNEWEVLLKEKGSDYLWQRLKAVDSDAAGKISKNDHYRLVRALEIFTATGQSLSDWKKKHAENKPPFPYPLLKMGIDMDRKLLLKRVQQRTEQMLKLGLIEEVESLLQQGREEWPPLSSVGYYEVLQFLKGKISSKDHLQESIVVSTLQLAKKQRTWFQRDSEIHWLNPDETPPIDWIRNQLNHEQSSSSAKNVT